MAKFDLCFLSKVLCGKYSLVPFSWKQITVLAVMGSELSYLLLILLSAEYDEEYEEAEDEDHEAEKDGGDEPEDDVALL